MTIKPGSYCGTTDPLRYLNPDWLTIRQLSELTDIDETHVIQVLRYMCVKPVPIEIEKVKPFQAKRVLTKECLKTYNSANSNNGVQRRRIIEALERHFQVKM